MIPRDILENIFSGEEVENIKQVVPIDCSETQFEVLYNNSNKENYTLEALQEKYRNNTDSDDVLLICHHCGKMYVYNENQPEVDDNYCESCFNETFIICDDCDGVEERWNAQVTSSGDIICNNCYENNYFYCTHCEQVICNDNRDSYETYDGDIICSNCYEQDFFGCDECGGIYNRDDLRISEDEDTCYTQYFCSDCYEYIYGREGIKGMIYDYHGFRNWTNLGTDSNLRFGFELEVEQCNSDLSLSDCATEVYKIMNHEIICSRDSSLNHGFEIVSHPMTFEYLQSRKDNIKEMLKYLSESGYRSHDPKTCGLHIHVSRNALGDDDKHIDRTINNILMIFENFMEELIIFSRRDETQINRWAQFISKYKGFNGQVLSMKFIADNKKTCGRYMAVNLEPANTIEFRLFRGTLNYNTFMATFQLLYNIIEFAKNNESINGLTWNKLIGKNKNLKEYCTIRGIESKTVANEIIIKFENKKPKNENTGRYDNVFDLNTESYSSAITDATLRQQESLARQHRENEEIQAQIRELERAVTEQRARASRLTTVNNSNNVFYGISSDGVWLETDEN
jgi:hypothetical protein